MTIFAALLAGMLFGLGLIVSGMTNPEKVLNFLDIAGNWDPSLAFVMLGAIAVGFVGFRLIRGRSHSVLKQAIQLPQKTRVDTRLIVGSCVFGIGWGIAGICPGPAIVLTGFGSKQGLLFLVAMLIGMAVYEWIELTRKRDNA